jgi:hypothetical protein
MLQTLTFEEAKKHHTQHYHTQRQQQQQGHILSAQVYQGGSTNMSFIPSAYVPAPQPYIFGSAATLSLSPTHKKKLTKNSHALAFILISRNPASYLYVYVCRNPSSL